MALQAGMGVSKIILIAGAGCTGTILLKNGKMSDILGELQKMVKGNEKSGESGGDADYSEAIALQVRRLASEVRQIASSKQITILNGASGQNILASLAVPAAVVGALSYGYMRWKGIKFCDMMYVTKQSMANAVSNMTKHLDTVQEALAVAKRHLTQRIENVNGKLDNQMEMSKLIRNEVNDAHGDLSQIGFDIEDLHRMVAGLDDKLISLEGKQELANIGIMYLCEFTNGRNMKIPDILQDQLKIIGKSNPAILGLKDVLHDFESSGTLLFK